MTKRQTPEETRRVVEYVRLVQSGDRSAIRSLIEATQERLLRFCLYLTTDLEKARELSQDTFVKAIRKIDSVQKPESFYSWLFLVAKTLFLSQVRTNEHKVIESETTSSSGHEDEEDPLLKIAEENESDPTAILSVKSTLEKLSPKDRLVLVLVDQQDYSYEEAAQVLEITEDAVRSRLKRARKSFIEAFEARPKKPAPNRQGGASTP